jgi:hypothetical protein
LVPGLARDEVDGNSDQLHELVSMAPVIHRKTVVGNRNYKEQRKRKGERQKRKSSSPQGRVHAQGSWRRAKAAGFRRRPARKR